MKKLSVFLCVFCFLLGGGIANALTIVGDSDLIDPSDNRIETWLGEGPLTLTNIYTRNITIDTMSYVHDAVDDKGPTITVFEVNVDGTRHTVGGYNPLPWHTGGVNYTSVYDAFIFDLTPSYEKILHQSVTYQTGNSEDRLAFGAGHDLFAKAMGGDPTVWSGHAYASSYRDSNNDGAADVDVGYGNGLYGISGLFTISKFEVFSVASGESVPEPTTILLLGSGLLGLAGFRRKFRKK